MSETWEEIQAVKSKTKSLREKLEKRKKERQSILGPNVINDKNEGSPSRKDKSASSTASKGERKSFTYFFALC